MKLQIKHHKVDQNTDEWLELRLGKFTASMFKDLKASKSTLTYKKAIYNTAFEILTGEVPENFSSGWMERGRELEPLAREQYEMLRFDTVEDGGFWEANRYVGASPDGLVNNDGLLEIKSPAPHTFIEYYQKKKLPTIYEWQVQGQLLVTGRDWCDFMAYHPKLKPLIIRVERDEVLISEIELALDEAIEKVEAIVKELK